MENQERFIDAGDGIIKDTKTGLMWPKDGSKNYMYMDFNAAENYCKDFKLGGFEDWRLPTREELESILDLEKAYPAINPIFTEEGNWYWSSTTYAGNSDDAWLVDFGDGYVGWYGKDSSNYVRPVRQY
jgi:hypothetical protein